MATAGHAAVALADKSAQYKSVLGSHGPVEADRSGGHWLLPLTAVLVVGVIVTLAVPRYRLAGRIGFNVSQYWLICPSESLIVEAGEEKRVNLCDAADG